MGWMSRLGRMIATLILACLLSDLSDSSDLSDLFGSLLAAQNPPPPTDLEQSRKRIEEIRAERERLERQQSRLRGQIQDVTTELQNLERQRDITNRLVNEIERQISGLGSQLDQSSAELVLAQDNLVERRAVLNRRLVDIYKRGPLYTWRVLLTAESFGDLLSRYKYLYLTSRQDRTIFTDVSRLSNRIGRQRTQLREVRSGTSSARARRPPRASIPSNGMRPASMTFWRPSKSVEAAAPRRSRAARRRSPRKTSVASTGRSKAVSSIGSGGIRFLVAG